MPDPKKDLMDPEVVNEEAREALSNNKGDDDEEDDGYIINSDGTVTKQ